MQMRKYEGKQKKIMETLKEIVHINRKIEKNQCKNYCKDRNIQNLSRATAKNGKIRDRMKETR